MSQSINTAGGEVSLSDDTFRYIADYTYDWESWISPNGKLLWVNRAVERMTGYSINDCMALADYPHSLVVEEDQQIVSGILQEANNETSGNDVPFRIRRKNGTIIWVAFSWNPMYDDQGVFLGCRTSARNFTERKIADDLIKKNEEQFSSIVQNIPGTIYRCKAMGGGEMLFISNQFESISGYPISKFMGKSKNEFVELIHPDDLEESQKTVESALQNKIPFDVEYRLIAKGGDVRWVKEKGQGIYNPNGELQFQDGTFFDITEFKTSQLKIEQSENQLKALFDALPIGAIFMTNDGKVMEANKI